MNSTTSNRVVLGPPYDGAFIWLINTMEHNKNPYYTGDHPYYCALYGENHSAIASHSASLSIIYDEIYLAPADIGLPDSGTFEKDAGNYYNSDIGLHHSWPEFGEHEDELAELVERDLATPEIVALIPADDWLQKPTLERINYQILLSHNYDAKLLTGPEVRKILDLKARLHRNAPDAPVEHADAAIVDRYFEFACFHFNAPRYDDIVALKQNDEVARYAASFHKQMNSVADTDDPLAAFTDLMLKARKRTGLVDEVRGGLTAGGRICKGVGYIPGAAWAANLVGDGVAVSDVAAKKARDAFSWYMLGPKMSEVLLEERLNRPNNAR